MWKWIEPRVWWLIPLLLALIVHAGCLQHDFVNFDDNAYVTDNPHVRTGLSVDNVRWAFEIHGPSMWIPLTWLSHQSMVSVFGLGSPLPHHACNLLLHMANVVLVAQLIACLSRKTDLASWVACLYAVHPIHVESVSWLTERKDVLAGLFFWSTLLLYARARNRWRAWNLMALLALMSKPSTVTLPCVLWLMDFALRRGWSIRSILEKVPLLVMVAASSWLTILCQKSAQALSDTDVAPVSLRLVNAVQGYAAYLRKLVFPFDLTVSIPYQFEIDPVVILLSLGLLLALTCWVWLRRERMAWFSWLLFLGMLVPMIGIVQAGGQWIADRYLYLPGVGVYFLVISRLPLRQPACRIVLALVVLFFSMAGMRQTKVWRSSETLFRHAVLHQEQPFLAHNNLGLFYKGQGDRERARFHFQQSLGVHGTFPEALSNLAILWLEEGQGLQALPLLERALQQRPDDPRTLHNLGRYWLERDLIQALPYLNRACEFNPSFVEAWYNLGYVHLMLGQLNEAAAAFERVLALQPDHGNAQTNLALVKSGTLAGEAVVLFQQTMRSHDPVTALALADRLREMNAPQTAGAYQRVLALRPDYPEALNNLGVWLADQHRVEEALPYFMRAVQLNPAHPEARQNLSEANRLIGR